MPVQNLYHFYHIYSNGKWHVPLHEHLSSIQGYGLYDNLSHLAFGIVGSKKTRDEVKSFLKSQEIKYSICAEVDDGWEQETLDPLHDYMKENDGYVFYAHTKTAVNGGQFSTDWRRSMTYYTVNHWRKCVDALDRGAAAAGTHYTRTDGGLASITESAYFAGTFFWVNGEYVKRFSRPERLSRFDAESWICQLPEIVQSMGREFYVYDPNHHLIGNFTTNYSDLTKTKNIMAAESLEEVRKHFNLKNLDAYEFIYLNNIADWCIIQIAPGIFMPFWIDASNKKKSADYPFQNEETAIAFAMQKSREEYMKATHVVHAFGNPNIASSLRTTDEFSVYGH